MVEMLRQGHDVPASRILLIIPNFHGYEDKLSAALEDMGHQCLRVDERPGNGFWLKALARLRLLQRVKPLIDAHVERIVENAQSFDPEIVLVVNAETLKAREIKRLRRAFPQARFLLYMWDSSAKKDVGVALIQCFDRAYSFDPVDSRNIPGLVHLPLFHSHKQMELPTTAGGSDHDYDFSFVGTARLRRLRELSRIAAGLRQSGRPYLFYLYAASAAQYAMFRVAARMVGYRDTLTRVSMPYEQYANVTMRSRCIVDIEQSDQNGLTIRTIEAVFSGRPLVTSNCNIGQYDFAGDLAVSTIEPGPEGLMVPNYRDVSSFEGYFEKYGIRSWLGAILSERVPDYFGKGGKLPEDARSEMTAERSAKVVG
jgi:hypothetical protein